jgi:hypothetical protein
MHTRVELARKVGGVGERLIHGLVSFLIAGSLYTQAAIDFHHNIPSARVYLVPALYSISSGTSNFFFLDLQRG